jgi:competence protein ComGC
LLRYPDLDIILSPLEKTSPLQDLLMYSITLDIIILILLISILLLIFNRYIVKYNLTFINYLIQQTGVNKYIPIKFINW